jgi:hypothetical protein
VLDAADLVLVAPGAALPTGSASLIQFCLLS